MRCNAMGTSRTTVVCAARDANSQPVRCDKMQCDGHIAHHWCVLQEMRAVNRRDAMRCNAMSTSRTTGVCCKRCEQSTSEMQ